MSEQRIDDRAYDTPPTPQPVAGLPNEPYYQQPAYQQPAYQQPAPANQKSRRTLGVALVVVGLVWLASGGIRFNPFPGMGTSTLYDNTVAGSRLEMNVGSGDVEIRSWDGDGIHITATQHGGRRDTYTVDVTQSGDTVRVAQSERDFFSFGDNGVRYEVQIPAALQATIETTSGEITIDGASGGATLTSKSGDVEARNISNGVTIDTASGEVKLRDASGTLNVKTISGDIELNDVADTLNLESTSGEIAVRDAHAVQLTASTTSGDIQYNGELAQGQNKITTISGEVDVRLPDDSDLRVVARSTSGEINSDFPLNGDRGSNGLTVETTSGDITIK